MGAQTIEIARLLSLAVLVIPVLVISRHVGLKINKSIIVSIIRMTIQLSLVGVYLQYLFDLNLPWLNVAYVVVMMGVASISIIGSTPLKFKSVFFPIFISVLVPNLLMLLFFNGVVVNIDQLFDAKYMITIGGMLLGNGLSGNIVGLSTFYKGLVKSENIYQYDLSLGATRYEACLPHFRDALLVSLNPTIASMATIGLVALPGMMTGQILGGSVPIEAIRYQIAIMIAIFVTKFFNVLIAIMLTSMKLFDAKDQLRREYLKV